MRGGLHTGLQKMRQALTIKLYVVRIQHGQEVLNWNVDIVSVWSHSETGGGRLGHRPPVVRLLQYRQINSMYKRTDSHMFNSLHAMGTIK